jgi:hypothetical protein
LSRVFFLSISFQTVLLILILLQAKILHSSKQVAANMCIQTFFPKEDS